MKLYESKHFVITVPMNEYFSRSLLLPEAYLHLVRKKAANW